MTSLSALNVVDDGKIVDVVEEILGNVLDEVAFDKIDEGEGEDEDEDNESGGDSASEEDGDVPSIFHTARGRQQEGAPFDEAELRKRIAFAISSLRDFCNSFPKKESEPDMNYSESSTSVSSGLHSPHLSDTHQSDTSYCEEPSCEIDELSLEESTIAPHRLIEDNGNAAYGNIPLEHLAKPEKYSNQYLEVRKSKLGGYGVFAKTDLKKGQLIHVESPQIIGYSDSVNSELDKLAPEVREAFMRMHAHKRFPEQEPQQAIFLTNAFAIKERSCVYMIASRFNHTCMGTQSVEYHVVKNRVMEFRMMRDVPAGIELTISYGPLSPQQLYTMWGFRCACGGCKPLSDEDVARIDREYSTWWKY
ncbi:hypothetical protein F5B19DRAFT_465508 [Rostrohypoxylon terebratum]|nr:hypothetical protein F5B19DRAFT_465508 [Rostrohypoxylon terebratum]